ncbi:MAG: hypothetical protein ACI8RO_002315 [Flavobacteriales bacterium]|jgi:hypothetical protein
MRVLIDNYRNLTAGHCGSGAMRNLIFHYTGLDLPEGVIFGLGAGLDCVFVSNDSMQPPAMLFGRGASMEVDLAAALGIDYREQIELDNDIAWQLVKDEIVAGRPTMLSGDIYYLDYREFKVHFPAHRFVLVGFDEDKQEVYIADRTDVDIQTCSMQALRDSRNPTKGGMSTFNNWGKFFDTKIKHDLPYACGLALHKTVLQMQGIDKTQQELMSIIGGKDGEVVAGLAGIRAFREHFQTWRDSEHTYANIQYSDSAIIKFGTGGGFFRDHFVSFMHWSKQQRPDLVTDTTIGLAEEAAKGWNDLSPTLRALMKDTTNDQLWLQADAQILDLYETEYTMFGFLADLVLRGSV